MGRFASRHRVPLLQSLIFFCDERAVSSYDRSLLEERPQILGWIITMHSALLEYRKKRQGWFVPRHKRTLESQTENFHLYVMVNSWTNWYYYPKKQRQRFDLWGENRSGPERRTTGLGCNPFWIFAHSWPNILQDIHKFTLLFKSVRLLKIECVSCIRKFWRLNARAKTQHKLQKF